MRLVEPRSDHVRVFIWVNCLLFMNLQRQLIRPFSFPPFVSNSVSCLCILSLVFEALTVPENHSDM